MEISVEKLTHFKCKFCKKWWSIGDAPSDKLEWFCPWCGILDKIEKVNASFNP